eukprot:CAMPEP_0117759204 /NCGR_PEP_ID=MMETSP0947-20121206/15872_1 /TAXON_ID=44440 /ORGANISM="Chattonella subsalsa, Strain CCMP2191" /LENGTH=275 /DNA_ID=CAMNT_0005579613 /DNA_START=130 /DNA_END=957 /DNA_ORIENTATION=+
MQSTFTRTEFSGLIAAGAFGLACFPRPTSAEVSTEKQTDAAKKAVSTPKITHKVFMEIKIASILDASNNYSSYGDYRGQLVFGLYGKDAPKSTNIMLKFMEGTNEESPTYATGLMTRSTPGVIMEGGKIKNLNPVTLAGVQQYEYRGNIVLVPSAVEPSPIKHVRRGLLTREVFSNSPEFGITLDIAPDLDDGRHTVFGELLEGDEVLQRLEEIPTYSYKSTEPEGSLADDWYQAQKRFFVNAGKIAGDQRAVDQTGKLLRKVEIKNCGILEVLP